MAWCERCAIEIHFHYADDHAIGHSGDDHIGNYGAKDISAKSFLCHECWSTHKPYVDESDEKEIESDTNPERHPNRLRWGWPGRLKEALDAAARRERAASAVVGDSQVAGDGRAARRPRRAAAAPKPKPLHRPASRRPSGAAPASRHTTERTRTSPGRHTPPAPVPPPGSHPAPQPPPVSLHQCSIRRPSLHLSRRLISEQRSRITRIGRLTISRHPRRRPSPPPRPPVRRAWSDLRRSLPTTRHLLGAGLTSRTWAHLPERRRFLCYLL